MIQRYKAIPVRYAGIFFVRKVFLINAILLYLPVIIFGNKLMLVLFVGLHFSGSLFKAMCLSI